MALAKATAWTEDGTRMSVSVSLSVVIVGEGRKWPFDGGDPG
jgi:hypothetical protein